MIDIVRTIKSTRKSLRKGIEDVRSGPSAWHTKAKFMNRPVPSAIEPSKKHFSSNGDEDPNALQSELGVRDEVRLDEKRKKEIIAHHSNTTHASS
jgi:hypothetical protein